MQRRFPLAMLLAVREQAEDAEERRLAQMNTQVLEIQQILRRLAGELDREAKARVGQAQTVRLAADHLGSEARWRGLRSAEAEMEAKLQVMEAKRSLQLKAYLRARSDRETLAEMQNQHQTKWEAHEKLREQKAIGDLFNARRKRR